MKRPAKKVATDRSFRRRVSRGLEMLCAHFIPTTGFLAIRRSRPVRTCQSQPFALTYTLTKTGLSYTGSPLREVSACAISHGAGYAALANLGVRHLSEAYREKVMRETGGAVAVGGRDRTSMIYFGQAVTG